MERKNKLFKRSIALLVMISLLLGNFGFVTAAEEYTSGNFTYSVSDEKATITAYPETAKGSVDIPSKINGYTVVAIGNSAFFGCTLVTEVVIPDTVTSIGTYSFAYCTSLEKITIPSSVKTIGKNAFKNSKDVKIACAEGSAIYNYAIENGIAVEAKKGIALDNAGVYYDGFSYTDKFFENSSYIYNHEMAKTSLCLEIASWVSDGEPYEEPKNAKDILSYYNFDIIKAYGYTVQPQMDSIACVIGCKDISVNGLDETVIVISIRGGGYEAEWSGNFLVGNETHHEGFRIACGKALVYLNTFIRSYSKYINKNVKFWVTGYSRAAATANLVAAALDNGGYDGDIHYLDIEELTFEPNDVYAYTFETPLNTTDSSAGSSKYKNIFNIVNRVDLVTKVAPEAWGYRRYGIDCYLPSAETHDAYFSENGYVKKMKKAFSDITGGSEYIEDFCFKQINFEYEYDFDIGDLLLPPIFSVADDIKVSIVDNNEFGMGRYLDELFEIVADDIIGNRKTYVKNYQAAMRKLAPVMFGVKTEGIKLDEPNFWKEFYAALETMILVDVNFPTKNAIKGLLATTIINFFPETKLTYSEVYDAIGLLDDLLVGLISHPNYVISTFYNISEIMPKHEPEVCLAWMIALDGELIEKEETEDTWLSIFGKSRTYRYVTFNCPINIKVYDDSGNLRASIVDDIVENIGDYSLSASINENGSKCICLPNDGKYVIEIIGTDSGTMSCTFSEYDFVDCEEKISQNYYNIPIEEGTEISVAVDELEHDEEISIIEMIDSEGSVIESSETISCETAEKYNVSVKATSKNCSVYGGGNFVKGEFAQVQIVPHCDGIFEGWYINDSLVSDEMIYRFMVNEDCELVAKYTDKYTIEWNVDGELEVTYHEPGEEIIAPLEPSKAGYTFMGWTPEIPEKMPDHDLVFTAEFKKIEVIKTEIRKPSTTTISYGDSITLHVDGELPAGYYVEWTADNSNFSWDAKGNTCKISPEKSGSTTFTATVYDAGGNPVSTHEQTMTSKAGFFNKIIAFFKRIFGMTKDFPEVFFPKK